ncbi:classical arabinogalactan protein 26-like [Senna tora]|uniref:Classical arabinogalactan protein 26-like n=1 Tax=Senna tora TaxID=362788 RepID=A0A834X2I6_9FABA|nr:classical arabinogalactan protein 26-like [Senna tora]
MASFSVHHALIFMLSFLLSSPAALKDPPLSSFQQLSPDIAPLLPSPGEVLPTDIPTIPSSPSPPNPDDTVAFSPFGLLHPSSTASRSIDSSPGVAIFFWFGSLLVFTVLENVNSVINIISFTLLIAGNLALIGD